MKRLFCVALRIRSWIEDDRCEGTGQLGLRSLARACGDEQLVSCSIACGPATEGDSPQVGEANLPPELVSDRTHEFTGHGIESIDSAIVGVV